jgi:hypothetical protein
VAPGLLDPVEERVHLEPACDRRPATGQQRRERTDHDSIDVEQRQDEQAVIVRGHHEAVDHRAAHGIQIRVIEHDALWPPGRPARVDQQRQRAVRVLRRVQDVSCGLPTVEHVGGHNDWRPGVELRDGLGDQHLGCGVGDLIAHLGWGEGRVDRGYCRAEAPRREQRHHEAGGVRQHDRHNIAGQYAVAAQ